MHKVCLQRCTLRVLFTFGGYHPSPPQGGSSTPIPIPLSEGTLPVLKSKGGTTHPPPKGESATAQVQCLWHCTIGFNRSQERSPPLSLGGLHKGNPSRMAYNVDDHSLSEYMKGAITGLWHDRNPLYGGTHSRPQNIDVNPDSYGYSALLFLACQYMPGFCALGTLTVIALQLYRAYQHTLSGLVVVKYLYENFT